MVRYGFGGRRTLTGTQGSTRFVRLSPLEADLTARPVISLHGWSGDPAATVLAGVVQGALTTGMPYDALLATGRTIYMPFTGPCFGHPTLNSPTGLGGTGTTAITDMVTRAAADGLTAPTVDIIGGSMGACNAINWAVANPTLVHRIYGYVPAVEFSSLYDLGGGIQSTLVGIYGGADKTAFMAASAARDPYRMDLSTIADRIAVVASNPDALIRYAGVVSWASTWGIPLATTTSNHFSLDDAGFSEFDVLAWLA